MKNICNKHGVQVYYKGENTTKSLLMTPKDKDHIKKKSGIIYRCKCNRVCDDEYIGESSRTFGERFREHLKTPSPIYDYYNATGHSTTTEDFSIVGKEDQNLIRAIKEAIYIRVNNPSPEQEHRQVPSASHMGWGSVQHLRTHIKIDSPQWLFHLPHGYNLCHTQQ